MVYLFLIKNSNFSHASRATYRFKYIFSFRILRRNSFLGCSPSLWPPCLLSQNLIIPDSAIHNKHCSILVHIFFVPTTETNGDSKKSLITKKEIHSCKMHEYYHSAIFYNAWHTASHHKHPYYYSISTLYLRVKRKLKMPC